MSQRQCKHWYALPLMKEYLQPRIASVLLPGCGWAGNCESKEWTDLRCSELLLCSKAIWCFIITTCRKMLIMWEISNQRFWNWILIGRMCCTRWLVIRRQILHDSSDLIGRLLRKSWEVSIVSHLSFDRCLRAHYWMPDLIRIKRCREPSLPPLNPDIKSDSSCVVKFTC